jgi:K+-transporting ATPase A subunit
MIAGPIVFIIFNAIEIVKAVISSDEEKIRNMWSNLIKRVVALILLFLVPLIITIIMSVSGNAGIFNENVPEVCLDK